MYQTLRCDAEKIARGAIAAVSPEAAVRRVLTGTGNRGYQIRSCGASHSRHYLL